MHTVLLSPELFLHEGGIARILRLYLKALCENAAAGDRVDALVLNDEPGRPENLSAYANDRFGEITGCSRHKATFLRHALRLARGADLFVCGHLHQLPIAWLATRWNSRARYVLVAHGIEVWRPYRALEKRALLGAHRILCVSDYTRRQMLRFCPELSPAKLVVVPNTLDPRFAPIEGTRHPATSFAMPRILAVGRLDAADAYKGFDLLIEAMPRLRKDFPAALLRIVGQGDDRPRLTALAQRMGVAGWVDFVGGLDDAALRGEYAFCDFFALPSRREGFGLVYLEAMTHGKSCLAARAGGAPEVVNEDVGTLVEYGHPDDVAAGLAELTLRPRDSGVVRGHASSFAFPIFQRRLATALA